MFENFQLTESAPISFTSLFINLAIGAIVSIILKIHYKKYGSTISNREEFSNIFPLILLTTTLVITIVKSSLALSLGLVGALSIVRFRTPIKEPEELSYLFICIAAGLGFGANQTLITVTSVVLILLFMMMFKIFRKTSIEKNMFISLELNTGALKDKADLLKKINKIILNEVNNFDLRRFDTKEENIEATYMISVKKIESIENLMVNLRKNFPGISVTYIDQNQIPSI
tara:strand:+ start:191 stop:877 length:687 start_codon:yes stop_codon:yes gene_type:complete